ncbi:MAG: 2-C-methyl-D-erythritol 4-phosphate cytidylyltransferase [Candidatus Izemoplasma sp.]
MYSAIILAAGSGERAGLGFNKVLFHVHNQEILNYSVDFFNKDIDCKELILVVSQPDLEHMEQEYSRITTKIVIGGVTRQESVYKALQVVTNDYVLIHDGARPFIPVATVKALKIGLKDHYSITPGIRAKDTIKVIEDNFVVKTLNRDVLFRVQTPQAFHTSKIIEAHKMALKNNYNGTDDTVLIEKYLNLKTFIVEGDYRNIKLTTKDDLLFLEVIL